MSQPPSHRGAPKRASEELLRSARSDHDPSGADRERVRRALARRLAEAADMLPEATAMRDASPPRALLHPIAKTGISLVLVAAGITALMRMNDQPKSAVVKPAAQRVAEAHEEPTRGDTQVLPLVTEDSVASMAAARERSAASTKRAAPRSKAARTAVPSADAVGTKTGERVTLEATSARAADGVRAKPSEPPDTETSAQRTALNPAAAGPAAQARSSAHAIASTRAERRQPSDELAAQPQETAVNGREELVFLTRIRAALLDAEHEQVLELCEEHKRRWPHGIFAQEREALRAIATCQTDSSKAAVNARAFFNSYPQSPMLPRVRAACAPQLKAATARKAD